MNANFLKEFVESNFLLFSDVIVSSQKGFVFAEVKQLLSDENVGHKHVLFYQRLRLHLVAFLERHWVLGLLIESKCEFSIHKHD